MISMMHTIRRIAQLTTAKPTEYLGSLDQSTTSTKFSIFSQEGQLLSQSIIEHQQFTPQQGWLEHDPLEIINNVQLAIDQTIHKTKQVAPGFSVQQLKGVGITNQRQTVVAWSPDGTPYHNALVWCDTRSRDICNQFIKKHGQRYKTLTGLPVSSYFTLFKILWLKQKVEEIQKAIDEDRIRFGTIDAWVVYNLTGKYVTDASNASRTYLCNLNGEWDQELLSIAGLKRNMLPEIVDSFQNVGKITKGALEGVQVRSRLGDQQASAYAQELKKNEMKVTYGTGVFMLANIGTKPIIHPSFITTILFKHRGVIQYAYECSVESGGGTLNWAKRAELFQQYKELNNFKPSKKEELYFFPTFGQIYAPFWKTGVKGGMIGLNLSTTKAHIVASILQSIIFRVYDNISMQDFQKLSAIFCDGGMIANRNFMQYQSDLINKSLIVRQRDTCWGVAKGVLTSRDEQFKGFQNEESVTYKPDSASHAELEGKYKEWAKQRGNFYGWKQQ